MRDDLLRRRPWCADPFSLHADRRVKATIRDHIIPLSRGGTDDKSNEQPLCIRCHNYKTAHDGSKRRGE
ncbi:HNH endonuclease [Chloroflexi bacterium CFX6]|nr:HNH endonuclease [Chloroflexi bacterium CFX6]